MVLGWSGWSLRARCEPSVTLVCDVIARDPSDSPPHRHPEPWPGESWGFLVSRYATCRELASALDRRKELCTVVPRLSMSSGCA
jgi:hypothetical protein